MNTVVSGASSKGAAKAKRAPTMLMHRVPIAGSQPYIVVAGTDGSLWFCDHGASRIGRFNPDSLDFTSFEIPTPDSQPVGIVEGKDQCFWFTQQAGNRIGRLTSDGRMTEYPIPTPQSGSTGIVVGPDGNIW